MSKLKSLLVALLLVASASASTLTGTVQNMTTGKPAAGDEVALIGLSQGMSVLAQTKTDASGKFSFNFDDANTPHLVRVTHQGVTYFPQGGPVRPGTSSVEIPVYDSAAKVDGVATNVTVLRIQADGGNLQVLQLMAVKNDSKPPRSMAGNRTYEFYLPEGAQIDQTIVQGPGGMPINTTAVPDGKSGKHYFNYAIKPGETRFEVAYHLPYSGEATFTPKISDNMLHFVVMVPKSISFEAKNASAFSPMNEDPNTTVQVASQVKPGVDLAFRVAGTGTLVEEQAAGQQQAGGGGDSRPGGGLGPPTDAPDPLHNFRWYVLGGLAVVLVVGGVFVVNRANQRNAAVPTTAAAPIKPAAGSAVPAKAPAPVPSRPQDRSAILLEALKEEMFQLEIEKQQGKISAEEYEKNKAAFSQTLSRALGRQPNS